MGDACNPDIDGDGVANAKDNCWLFSNPAQSANDAVAHPTWCTVDTDGDGHQRQHRQLPLHRFNPGQEKTTLAATVGDDCNVDEDGDGVPDKTAVVPGKQYAALTVDQGTHDNCPSVANSMTSSTPRTPVWAMRARPTGATSSTALTLTSASILQQAFQVNAGVETSVGSGETVTLPLWANRKGAAISYTYTVSSRPDGSTAAVVNPIGAVANSRYYQYVFPQGQEPKFTPDTNGTYTILLSAHLVYPDSLYHAQQDASAKLTLTVGGSAANPTGCSSTGAAGFAPLLALAAGLALALRRRGKK